MVRTIVTIDEDIINEDIEDITDEDITDEDITDEDFTDEDIADEETTDKAITDVMDFDTEHGVPPHNRPYPNMNPPPGHDGMDTLWPVAMKVEMNFCIDRNVNVNNRQELAYAIRGQAWGRLINNRFEDDPTFLPYRYYRLKFIFATQTSSVSWIHVFILRMMTEMAKASGHEELTIPFDHPFFRLQICE
ncbi:uncharacterized protein KD926_006389 [Aspergillus affinis]|uniref:uncharacterized protein n=1 Tax=Aspergillus affinis TaxID=1070780 RepID=UPI0022FEC1C9|nr:uncharacterized protein KD926_006389 [Aspergillus affinis]KAI9041844.1 hypothetical protein KD926_006389 [Aspergillus affinis]